MESVAAISTPAGVGGIAVVRLSGDNALEIADKVWRGKSLSEAPSHTVHLGEILNQDGEVIDQCVATVFHKGKSFTGEDTVEFSIHGSKWIQREVLALLIEGGASAAGPGEFTRRAFMNGRLDLAQAEAVGDLINSDSKASHRLAANQMKGNFSAKLESIREDMIQLASLLELELDFSEEDVEFADREKLKKICKDTIDEIEKLGATFRTGRVLKEGVPVVIAGVPNAGKSTLLNHLIGEEKAIVSNIPGTTRDVIEDTAEIGGVLYRFIDTAGLRESADEIEKLGIERAYKHIGKARVILWLIDRMDEVSPQIELLKTYLATNDTEAATIPVFSKSDIASDMDYNKLDSKWFAGLPGIQPAVNISAKTGKGIEELEERLTGIVGKEINDSDAIIITNLRHYEALKHTAEALKRTEHGLEMGISGDFVAQDLREAIHHLGTITGAITTDTLLHSIFSRFCIGK